MILLKVVAAVIPTIIFLLILIELAESNLLRQWWRALSTQWDRIVNYLDMKEE